jgi:hypothetical protein
MYCHSMFPSLSRLTSGLLKPLLPTWSTKRLVFVGHSRGGEAAYALANNPALDSPDPAARRWAAVD